MVYMKVPGEDPAAILCDVLVVGGGVAAMAAALEAAKFGCKVIVVDKGRIGRSGSSPTSGGNPQFPVPAEMGGDPDDGPQVLARDIFVGGEGLADTTALDRFVNEGFDILLEHHNCGVSYLMDSGRFKTIKTLGMSYPRLGIVREGGIGLTLALRKELLHRGVEIRERVTICEVLCSGSGVYGAIGIQEESRELLLFYAPVVILALGSATELFPLRSASYPSTGDGYALVLKAGAMLRNMEFIEFTVIPCPRGIPVSTGGIKPTLAMGARLVNTAGDEFLPPGKGELTRSQLVRAIDRELSNGKGPCLLDASLLTEPTYPLKKIKTALGIDYRREMIPWYPAVHTFLGGAWVDDCGRTQVPGLFCTGENAGFHGIFGADRIGGALAACQVLGALTGREAALTSRKRPLETISKDPSAVKRFRWEFFGSEPVVVTNEYQQDQMLRRIQRTAVTALNVRRTALDLCRAIADFIAIRQELDSLKGILDPLRLFALKNLALTGEAVARSAFMREESRGQHLRTDFPTCKERLKGWICVKLTNSGLACTFQPLPTTGGE